MISLRSILYIVGFFLCILSALLTLPLIVSYFKATDDWRVFLSTFFITLFVGILLILANKSKESLTLTVKEAFVLTPLTWAVVIVFASMPFAFSSLGLSWVDAIFESTSALTTTGATVIHNLDQVPRSILLWRAMLQWVGGIGIVVVALIILPILRIGGMQVFRSESADQSEKILPRVTQIAAALTSTYVALTFLCIASIWLTGMNFFNAFCHGLSTIATGGFSTTSHLLSDIASDRTLWVMALFMFLGGCPIFLFTKFWDGNVKAFFKDQQVRAYFLIMFLSSMAIWVWLMLHPHHEPWDQLLLSATFNVTSILTTTGFTAHDYEVYPPFAKILLFFLMFVGGCTGSTSGGIKVYRFQVIFQGAIAQLRKLRMPHGIFSITFNSLKLGENVFLSIISFFALYLFVFFALALMLGLCGLDFMTALTGAASALGNVGPGFGELIGPTGNYAALPQMTKAVFSFGMLMGRLELMLLLVLMMPSFWRE